jgi:hypothetical protein
MMRNINPFGILIVAVGVLASYSISIYQGLQFSESLWIAGIYALIGAAAVTWEMIGWHRCAHLLREERHTAFAANVAGLALASVVTILLFELAFLATALEGMASRNTVTMDNRAALTAERASLQASIRKGGAVRGLAAIDSEIAGIKLHPRWASTHGCTPEWITAKASRALCEQYSAAVQERGQALSTRSAQQRIREISKQLTPLGDVGAADARALYLSRIFGTSEQTARMLVGFGVIAFLFFCRAIAPFVMWDAKTDASAKPSQALSVATHSKATPVHTQPYDNGEVDIATLDAAIAEMLKAEEGESNRQRSPIVVNYDDSPDHQEIDAYKTELERNVASFVKTCMTRSSGAREGASLLFKAYNVWAKDNNLLPVKDQSAFGKAITKVITGAPYNGDKIKSNGSWYYCGARLSPAISKSLMESPNVKAAPLARRRLGGTARVNKTAGKLIAAYS